MSSIVARTGRELQRFEANHRLVSGSIPYRLRNDNEDDLAHRIEVLLISTPNRDDLVFPKGGWEIDETVEEAAVRETLEEAGVSGVLEKPLGFWEFKSKSSQETGSLKPGCRVYMFALRVTEEHDTWPEQGSHSRKWLLIKDAFKFCRYEWMHEALEEFGKVMIPGQTMSSNSFVKPIGGGGSLLDWSLVSSKKQDLPSSTVWLQEYLPKSCHYQLVFFIFVLFVIGLL